MSRTYASTTKLGWWVTQGKVITRFKAIQSITATAIKREENLHPTLLFENPFGEREHLCPIGHAALTMNGYLLTLTGQQAERRRLV